MIAKFGLNHNMYKFPRRSLKKFLSKMEHRSMCTYYGYLLLLSVTYYKLKLFDFGS